MIAIRGDREIDAIRRAGRIVAHTLDELKRSARAGVTTRELDDIAHREITKLGGCPAFKGYRGYPGNICASVNETVVHGIPSAARLEAGDILSLDVGVGLDGYFADAALTVAIGRTSAEAKRLISVTSDALEIGIAAAKSGKRLGDVSYAVQHHVESSGFSVVRAFVGHGIGTSIHEEPEIPNYGKPDRGPRLENGMVLAIEPMVNAGTFDVEILEDGWTAVTKDRKLSAHFEHTIVIRGGGAEILTS